jgi:tetratricopeptide (TPR) repeat protein
VRRHPRRALAVVALVGLIAFGLTAVASQVWAAYHFRAARTALDRYHTEEAADHLRACLEAWPNDPEVLFLAARAARRAGLFDDADDFLDSYQKLRGRDGGVMLERALLVAERGDVDEVITFCQAKVDANDATSPLALEAMARGYLRRFNRRAADNIVRVWEQRDPNNPMALLLRGRIEQERGADADAIAALRHALEIDRDLDDARDRLATVLLNAHQAPEAQPHLEYLHKRRPVDLELAVRLARCRDLLGQQDEAARLLDEVLARRPDYVPALAERGKLALRAGQRDEAEKWIRKALARLPGDVTLLRPLHLCLEQSGKDDEARELEPRLKRAEADQERLQVLANQEIPVDTENAELWYEGGTIWLRIGSLAEGRRWLENAVQFDPRHVKAHEALADSYQRTGDTLKAARHQKAAREAGGGGAKQ